MIGRGELKGAKLLTQSRKASWLIFWAIFLPPSLLAQTASSDSALIQQLFDRVNQLEMEVKELRSKANIQKEIQPTPLLEPPASGENKDLASDEQQAPVHESKVGEAVPSTESAAQREMPLLHEHNQIPAPAGASFPYVRVRGFGDLGYTAVNTAAGTNGFGFGQLDIFATAKLSSKLGVLVETVLEADQATNQIGIDIERLLLQYRQSDFFNLDVGRYHQSIGYYNTAYHHGRWFQTTVGRPFMFLFEDEGGLLPIHNVGVSASGRLPSGPLGLHYVFEAGNGRAYRTIDADPVQNSHDENNGKSVNLALFARPQSWPGWELGGSVYRDRLTPLGQSPIRQYIYSGHAVYIKDRVEFLNEGIWMRHARQSDAGRQEIRSSVPAFYTQFAYRVAPSWRPYLRYEYMNAAASDPIARAALGTSGWRQDMTVGVRFDAAEFMAIKFQLERIERRDLARTYRAMLNLSFTF